MIAEPGSDAEYVEWISAHPGGFILNTRARELDASYLVLHRASCGTITPDRKATGLGAFTERAYRKVCSDTEDELQEWIRKRLPNGTFSHRCGVCKP